MWWTAVFQSEWTASTLPPNTTPWEHALDGVDADLVARDPISLVAAARSDQQSPIAWLPYLAAERMVDEYDGNWPEARQREVVKQSFRVHQVKGTRPVLDRALAPFGYTVQPREWFEHDPPRPAYTFQIEVRLGSDPWSAGAQRSELIRIANRAKNAHTKLEAISLIRNGPPAIVHVGGMTRKRRVLRIGQIPAPTTIRNRAHVFLGAMIRRIRRVEIQPRPET